MQHPVIPLHVFERLEREWRLIDADRETKKPDAHVEVQSIPKRIRVGRVD